MGEVVIQQKEYEAIVEAEAEQRGLVVTEEMIRTRIEELRRQHQERTGGRIPFEESLRRNNLMNPERLEERIRIEVAASLMIRADLGLTAVEMISPEEQQRWLAGMKRRVKVTTEDLPEGVFVRLQWSEEKVKDITREEVVTAIQGILPEGARRAIQEQMIERELIQQLADARGITFEKSDVLKRFREMKEEWALLPANQGKKFEEEMAKMGRDMMQALVDPAMKYDVLLRKIVEPEVTDADVTRFFEENKDLLTGKRVKVAHILAATLDLRTGAPKDADGQAAAERRIQEVARRIKEGEDFATLAARYSDDAQTGSQGGLLGEVTRDMDIEPAFLDVAFSLEEGEVSEPFLTQAGWRVVKALEVNVTTERDPADEAFRSILKRMLVGQRMQMYLRQERQKAEVVFLVAA